ncbi:hypothetical protein KM176_24515 [Pseudooceanicola sp. CBS1P-1]|uniref:Uncharacterized protein n=1 Tax=Pseudooceanicola albus TaxID=2692189 RepID=A0A6L7GC94_9RHOB|nr:MULTISPECIES: hypothetical protein [Pseudooceanicola]MBT9387027.1 hypothetical protein [Pseudooceanicola endophyticus]MXN21168.1 hypothetical protein [Pseudooceanicola albus]
MSQILEVWYKRVSMGLLFILAGVMFGWLSEKSPDIVSSICDKGATPLWCLPVKLALVDFGLKAISYSLIFIGVFLSVFFTYIAELLGSILSFALLHVTNSKNAVIKAMEQGAISNDETSRIVVSILSRFMGYHDRNSESFAEFIVDRLLKQVQIDGGFWRRDYHAVIRVEELGPEEEGKFGRNYLRWHEINSFSVENSNRGGVYNYKSASTIELFDSTDPKKLLDAFSYDVRSGGEHIFSFNDHRESASEHDFAKPFEVGGLKMRIEDSEISIVVEKEIQIPHGSIDIVVDEESLISREDTTYELCLVEPTKRLTFRLNLPSGFKVFHHGCSGRRYGSYVADDVIVSQPGENRVGLDVYNWSLPGIATVLAWKPTEQ